MEEIADVTIGTIFTPQIAQRSTRHVVQRYKLDVKRSSIEDILLSCYKEEVFKSTGLKIENTDTLQPYIAKVSRWLTDCDTRPFLMLYGGVGNGKTTMAKAIALTYQRVRIDAQYLVNGIRWKLDSITQDCIDHKVFCIPDSIEFIKATELIRMARDGYSISKYIMCPAIILDDFGEEAEKILIYGSEAKPTTDLVNERCDNLKLTILTSNITDEALELRYGTRTVSRFDQRFDIINFVNKSYR